MTDLTDHTTDLTRPTAVPSVLPFADPGALGLGAFALTTFVLSFANAGWVAGAGTSVLSLALFYGGIAQVIAGIWEFANKNTFGATAFVSFGSFWLAYWFLVISNGAASAGPGGVGVFLLAWAIFTLYMSFAAIKTNAVILAVLVALTLTFLFLSIGAFMGVNGETVTHVGGYLGIITAILAWYGSLATVFNSTAKRAILPVWPSK
jgi:succinate-acetate transporter protein